MTISSVSQQNPDPQWPLGGSRSPANDQRMHHRLFSDRETTVLKTGAPKVVDREREEALESLDKFYELVKTQILQHQSYVSGLYPRLSTDKNVGYIRDSLYCAMACWALSRGYSRLDDDRGRTCELCQNAVKTMRGILMCWMRQCDKLEAFKQNPIPSNALHSKFHLKTSEEVETYHDYGHLQLDVIGLFLLTLVQFIASGLEVIFTDSEVNFVQNLVFYIERAYRVPDFGMWETGTRYNDGTPELHASSVGMVKAALEAVNGFNLFGGRGTSGSVIYVDIDAHNRNRITFETLLPRESNSKNTDAALLPTLTYPCFATHNQYIIHRTFEKCSRRLQGKYGFKRFLRDGYGTAIHDQTRRFYNQGETKLFDSIECQWPLFYVYLMIDGVFRGDDDQVQRYKALVEDSLVASSHGFILPMYYFLPEDDILRERSEPGSQRMYPDTSERDEEPVYLWGQAMYIIGSLLVEKLVHLGEIDPIHRYLPANQRPRFGNRYAVYKGNTTDPVVQVALISESTRLQLMLSTYGIQTQTPHQVEPIQIWASGEMVKVFENLGKNDTLGLSGRPARPLGTLSTSKVYRAYGETVICYPLLFEISDFYTAADPSIILDDIKEALHFVAKRWKLHGRPTVVGLLREQNISGERFPQVLALLTAFKNGDVDGTRVRIGKVQNFLSTSCIEYLDFAREGQDFLDKIKPFHEVSSTSNWTSLSDISQSVCVLDDMFPSQMEVYKHKHTPELIEVLDGLQKGSMKKQVEILQILHDRHGLEFHTSKSVTVRAKLSEVCAQAAAAKSWHVTRICAALLRKTIDSLAPNITSILVRGKQLTVGVFGQEEYLIDGPRSPDEIAEGIFRTCLPHDVPAAVLEQELIIALGQFMASEPDLFKGTLKIRLGWVIHALSLFINIGRETAPPESKTSIYTYSPMEIKIVLYDLLQKKNWHNMTPYQQRQINGSMNRVPDNFYDKVWGILEKTPGGILIASKSLPQQPTLSEMTEYELTFSLLVEHMLSRIQHPEYRQIIVELFMVVSTILKRNPELKFSTGLNIEELIRNAFEMYAKDTKLEKRDDFTPFYKLSPQSRSGTSAYLAKAVVHELLTTDEMSTKLSDHNIEWQCAMQ